MSESDNVLFDEALNLVECPTCKSRMTEMAAQEMNQTKSVLERQLEIAKAGLEDCQKPPYADSDLQSLIMTINDIARTALAAIEKVGGE